MRDLFRGLTDKDMHFPEHSVITKMIYETVIAALVQ